MFEFTQKILQPIRGTKTLQYLYRSTRQIAQSFVTDHPPRNDRGAVGYVQNYPLAHVVT